MVDVASAIAPFIGVIIGALISASAVLTGTAISNRAQDRRLRAQLFNDESKQALAELYRLINLHEKYSGVWRNEILKFLNSFEGRAFLLAEVRAWMKEHLDNFDKKFDETYPEEAAMEDYQAQIDEESQEMHIETMTDDERRDYDFKQHWKGVKREFGSYVIGSIPLLVSPAKRTGFGKRIRRSLSKLRLRKKAKKRSEKR